MSYHDPEVAFHEPSGAIGNIGNDILNELMVSIDQRNQRIAFKKATASVISSSGTSQSGKPRRLGVGFRGIPGGGDFTVASVADGSLGEEAGFQAGDVLIKLNGDLAANYDMTALGKLIGSSIPLRFDVLRNGKPYVIKVP